MIAQLHPLFPSQNSQDFTSCFCDCLSTEILPFEQKEPHTDQCSNFQGGRTSHSSLPNSCDASQLGLDSANLFHPQILTLTTNQHPEPKKCEIEDFPLGRFMRFLKHIKLKKLLTQITDLRDPKKTTHKIEIILQWVLSVFFFDVNQQMLFKQLLRNYLHIEELCYGTTLVLMQGKAYFLVELS